MSNKIYEDGFYNESHKEMYLKDLSEKTYTSYARVLKRARYVEEQLGKDLYNFNVSEIEKLLVFMSPSTYSASAGNINVVRTYIRWAIQEDLRIDNLNPLDSVISDDFINKFIDTTNKKLFTEEEINTIVGGLQSFQDAAIVQCLFEGIMGHEYSEILNILKKDVDRDSNELTVRNSPSSGTTESRLVKVSTKLMNLLYSAANETSYIKLNGMSNAKAKEIELIDNEYVFRSVKLRVVNYDRASNHLVLRRMKSIREWYDYPHLTATSIKNSGMLKYAKELYQQKKELTRNDIAKICVRFGVNSIATTRLTKDFLNIETLRSLYPDIDEEQA
jgi:integrase